MDDIHLGKNSHIPLEYDPKILTPLNRLDSRIKAAFKILDMIFMVMIIGPLMKRLG